MHSPQDEVAQLQSEVASLRSELGVSERLRIAMFSNLAQKGEKRGQEGQTAAVSMLMLGLNEELKRLRQGRIAQEKALAAAQADMKQAQTACQRLEGEKQDVLCRAEQQHQGSALQIECLQRACQDTVQHERARHGKQVNQLHSRICQMAEQLEADACRQAAQLHTSVEQERGTWDQLCRVEKQKMEEVQASLQRAQQHILDLQEQHRQDLESCKQGHAAETAHLRSDYYGFQNNFTEARQKHTRQVAQLEQLLQAREADLRSLQAVVDSTQQTADAQYTQQVDRLKMSLAMSATQHRQQLQDKVGQMNRLHTQQMERLQASHQSDQGVLQAAMDSLQVQSRRLQSEHQRWAWQLAALLHWKQQGSLQLRKLLHSWAMLTAASRSRRASAAALHRDDIRNSCEASREGHEVEISGAQRCRKEHSLAEQSCCFTAGAEDRLEGPMPDGWAHHDRRMLGGCFRGWLHALPYVSGTQDSQQEGCHLHGRITEQHALPCGAAAVSQKGRGQTVVAAAHKADHLGSCAMLEPAMQHVCQHHMQLPAEKQAEQAQLRLTSCSACFQPLHRPPEAEVVSPSASACFDSPSCPAPARAATALASRAIKQRSAGLPSSSSAHNPEVARYQCHVCSAQFKAAEAASTSLLAACPSQQEHCCDCGYVTKSPSLVPLNLGPERPASAGGCRAVKSAAYRPLSADVNKAASHSACRSLSPHMGTAVRSTARTPLPADAIRAASHSACRTLPADEGTAVRSTACTPLPADAIRAASHAAYRPMPADVMRAARHLACRPLSPRMGIAVDCAAGRPVLADLKGAIGVSTQCTAAVSLDGAVGDVLSQSVRGAAALTPVTQQQQGYRSPLSQLQQSFEAELGILTSFAARVEGPILEAGQGQHTRSSAVGSDCFPHGSAEVAHSAAAVHLVHQDGTGSHDTNQKLEVSPETSFLQMLDQCQQTDPDSLRVQLDQQQQTDTSSASVGDMPGFAGHSACGSPQSVDAIRQQQVTARALGSFIAQPQATAVATSTAPAATAAADESSEALSSSLAVTLDDSSQDSSAASAAGQLLQQNKLCQLGAIIADKAQSIWPRPLAGSSSQLLAVGMPPHAQSAPPVAGMPSTMATVTLPAFGTEDSAAGHAGFRTSSVAADTSAVQTTVSLPAVSALDVRPRCYVARQSGTHVDNAQQPALQTLPVMMAQCNNGSSQGVPVSAAELGAAKQQQPQHEAPTHAEVEHKAGSTGAVDVGVETDHRWLLSTAWAEQQQWIAARRRSGEHDTKWELDESGSVSGDSVGGVSSESTLRPSSVGRCRVNCGRNAKLVGAAGLAGGCPSGSLRSPKLSVSLFPMRSGRPASPLKMT